MKKRHPAVTKYLSERGRKAGSVSSLRKTIACRLNAAKPRTKKAEPAQ